MDESKLIEITRPGDGRSLCRTCYWVHAKKVSAKARKQSSACLGPMRKVPFRSPRLYGRHELYIVERPMGKIALIIATELARKKMDSLESVSIVWKRKTYRTYGIKGFAGGDRSRLLLAVGLRPAEGPAMPVPYRLYPGD
jgi:hypothetical protein